MTTIAPRGGDLVIPRDIECWYCRQGDHARCALPRCCACYRCYPRESGCTLCSGICTWACFKPTTVGI